MGRARLGERVLRERLGVLGRELDLVGQGNQLEPVEDLAQLTQLVLVARGHDDPPRRHQPDADAAAVTAASCESRSNAIAGSASASRSSSDARDTGIRSAVACTSTRPPSPLITTFASTSARESSE